MRAEDHIADALIGELKRQATDPARELTIELEDPPDAFITGRIDIDKLVMAIMGALAGGP